MRNVLKRNLIETGVPLKIASAFSGRVMREATRRGRPMTPSEWSSVILPHVVRLCTVNLLPVIVDEVVSPGGQLDLRVIDTVGTGLDRAMTESGHNKIRNSLRSALQLTFPAAHLEDLRKAARKCEIIVYNFSKYDNIGLGSRLA